MHNDQYTTFPNGIPHLELHTNTREESEDGFHCYKTEDGQQRCDPPPNTYEFPAIKYTEVVKVEDVSGMVPAPTVSGHVPKFGPGDWTGYNRKADISFKTWTFGDDPSL